jgi:hypothetical protein
MKSRKRVKLKAIMLRVDGPLLRAFDHSCRKVGCTREAALRGAMERATGIMPSRPSQRLPSRAATKPDTNGKKTAPRVAQTAEKC